MTVEGPFSQQQRELKESFEKLKTSTIQKMRQILGAPAPLDEQTHRANRAELDRQIENLHLAVSTYFGDCDKRKQVIEAAVSLAIDVRGFATIGAVLSS
jgi:hypothetical protein